MTPIQQLQYKKLQKKYAGSEWKYMAVDYSGEVWLYLNKPTVHDKYFAVPAGAPTSAGGELARHFWSAIEDWKDTLVEL